jgi:hypothetical protein
MDQTFRNSSQKGLRVNPRFKFPKDRWTLEIVLSIGSIKLEQRRKQVMDR